MSAGREPAVSTGRTGIGAQRWSRSCARCGRGTSSSSARSSRPNEVSDVKATETGEVEVSVRVPARPAAKAGRFNGGGGTPSPPRLEVGAGGGDPGTARDPPALLERWRTAEEAYG